MAEENLFGYLRDFMRHALPNEYWEYTTFFAYFTL